MKGRMVWTHMINDMDKGKNDMDKGKNDMDNGKNKAVWLPQPEPPLDSDCCGLGCSPCVFDLYEEEVKLWERECAGLLGREEHSDSNGMLDTIEGPVLSENEYKDFLITSIEKESCNSSVFTVKYKPGHEILHKTGQHVIIRIIADLTVTIRQYTPIYWDETQGYFKLLVKIYPTGKMSGHLSKLKIGDSIEMRGPAGGFLYKPNQWQCIYLLAGGTGIAPMTQIIRQVIANEEDDTRVYLVYSCQKYEDILLKSQLNEWTGYWNVSIKYHLTQDSSDRVKSLQRYGDVILYDHIKAEHLRDLLVSKPTNYQVFVCGTPSFDKDIINYLKDMEIQQDNFYKF